APANTSYHRPEHPPGHNASSRKEQIQPTRRRHDWSFPFPSAAHWVGGKGGAIVTVNLYTNRGQPSPDAERLRCTSSLPPRSPVPSRPPRFGPVARAPWSCSRSTCCKGFCRKRKAERRRFWRRPGSTQPTLAPPGEASPRKPPMLPRHPCRTVLKVN